GLTELRSISKFGLSLITIVFRDDVDIYLARQLVLERVLVAQEVLPSGLTLVMGPASTGLGEVFRYTVERVVSQVAGGVMPVPASLGQQGRESRGEDTVRQARDGAAPAVPRPVAGSGM